MRKIILAVILTVIASAYVFGENQISLSFSKNSSGELILTVEGHTTPVVVSIGENKVTLYPSENKVNLSALGISDITDISIKQADASAEKKSEEDIDTAAGAESSTSVDTQSPIPPVGVNINPNPPLATPY